MNSIKERLEEIGIDSGTLKEAITIVEELMRRKSETTNWAEFLSAYIGEGKEQLLGVMMGVVITVLEQENAPDHEKATHLVAIGAILGYKHGLAQATLRSRAASDIQ